MADLISRVSKISTRAKLWVVGLGLTVTFIWSVDTATAPGTPVAQPTSQPTSSASTIPAPAPQNTPAPTQQNVPASNAKGVAPAAGAVKAPDLAALAETELTGTYAGIVHNVTADISADFKILATESKGDVQGCMEVKPPLMGSGALRGAAKGSNVSFVVASDSMQIDFDGHREAANVNGTYVVSARNGGAKQTGTFTLQKISREGLSRGFNISNCAGDSPPASTPAGLTRKDKTVPTIPLTTPAQPITTELVPNPPVTRVTERPRPVPVGYFTVGSTKDEVLAVQGTPTSLGEFQWGYGLSHVSFQSGRVTGWYVSPVNSLRVKMLPDSESDASAAKVRGFFTAGSTKDEVLAVQGTPTSFSEFQWSYGLSHVSFQGGRVTSWYVSPVNALRVKMLASDGAAPVKSSSFFTVGSTKDEVLAVQGTPTSFSEYQWAYGLSHVSFQGGRVTSWYVSPVNSLRVKMVPDNETAANSARARGYFTVGSTKDEVLAVQGTPTSLSETQWSYGLSHVSFQGDKVTNWYISPVNALKAVLPNK